MKPEPTRVADWQEGQCGFDADGTAWFVVDGGVNYKPAGVGGVGTVVTSRIFKNKLTATIDESARQVFVDYFTRKGT